MATKLSEQTGNPTEYKPTERERAIINAHFERGKVRASGPNLKIEIQEGKAGFVTIDHVDPEFGATLLMANLASTDKALMDGLLLQLVAICSNSETVDVRNVNFLLSVMKAVEPKDELETLLAAQMAAVHVASMNFAKRLNHADTIQRQDSAEKAMNKLARTFAMQLEALKRYRTGGQQRVVVEHVTVNEGGQAIVGNVAAGGRGGSGNER